VARIRSTPQASASPPGSSTQRTGLLQAFGARAGNQADEDAMSESTTSSTTVTLPQRDGAVTALDVVRADLDPLLASFLDARVADLARLDPALERIGREVADLVCMGGKRLRPAFVYWGHRAAGEDHLAAVLHCAGAVELLQAFALIHDDVMDRSDLRRGRPTVHAALAAEHEADGLVGDPQWFGVGGAILAGDIAFVWADRLFDEAPLPGPALERARSVFTELRVEVMAGQYLDLRLAASTGATEDDALRVALLKSGRYTVTRPLQMGAAIAAGDEVLDRALAGYGDAIGLAFQLRDDVLGLYGDPEQTGKGTLDDLREGKRTLLVLRALERGSGAEREVLSGLLGKRDLDEADAGRAREIVRDTGALASVERLLDVQQEAARSHLGAIPPPARQALEQLADLALFRTA
jgi:geranylgeranyl diphosphate synthase type I